MRKPKRKALELYNLFNTTNPFTIASEFNIDIHLVDGLSDKFIGDCIPIDESGNETLILLNSNLSDSPYLNFYAAHELWHALEHADNAEYYNNNQLTKLRKEREANEFASWLCLAGEIIEEETTVYELMKRNYIPFDMARLIV